MQLNDVSSQHEIRHIFRRQQQNVDDAKTYSSPTLFVTGGEKPYGAVLFFDTDSSVEAVDFTKGSDMWVSISPVYVCHFFLEYTQSV